MKWTSRYKLTFHQSFLCRIIMNQTYLPNLCLKSYFYSLQSFCYQTSQEGDLIAQSPNHPLTISPIFHIYKRNRVTIRNSLTFFTAETKGTNLVWPFCRFCQRSGETNVHKGQEMDFTEKGQTKETATIIFLIVLLQRINIL